MNIKDIDTQLLNEYLEKKSPLDPIRAEESMVIKPEVKQQGYIVKGLDDKVGCNIYIDDLADMDEEGLADFLYEKFQEHRHDLEGLNPEVWLTKEYILDHVYPRLTNLRNIQNLIDTDTCFLHYLDLCIIYYIRCDVKDGYGSITLKKPHLDQANLTLADIKEQALVNQEKISEARSMFEVIKDFAPDTMDIDDPAQGRMYVFSNRNNDSYGASCILTEKFHNSVNALFGEKAYIIPSSIHEIIVVDQTGNAADLGNMIREVNETAVNPTEVLSDHPYLYDNGVITCIDC